MEPFAPEKINDPLYVLLPSRGMTLTCPPPVSASAEKPLVSTATSCTVAGFVLDMKLPAATSVPKNIPSRSCWKSAERLP